MPRARLILIFSFVTSFIYSQRPGDTFISKCEYFNFVNDTIIDFITISSHSGALNDFKRGIGIYKFEKNELTIQIKDNFNYAGHIRYEKNESDCGEIKEMMTGIINYKIISLSDDWIILIGPILADYKKLNKKRFFRGFLNWPWRWSFRKQHWFDPRERLLIKESNK